MIIKNNVSIQPKKNNFQHIASGRVIIENVTPQIDAGLFPIKRVVNETVIVQADIFAVAHDSINAFVLYRPVGEKNWMKQSMIALGNDRWQGKFIIEKKTDYEFTIQAWINHFEIWHMDVLKKIDAQQNVDVDIIIGKKCLESIVLHAKGNDSAEISLFFENIKKSKDVQDIQKQLISPELLMLSQSIPDQSSIVIYDKVLKVNVDQSKALFSAWYEFVPRSFAVGKKHGTFQDCEKILPEIARMGFDVVYLPPIHPIGQTKRKGKNNAPIGRPDEPGSPWAIGGKAGGHKSIEENLGSMQDFQTFVKKAESLGLQIALDLAYQCSPDHPYVKDHPEWFFKRPDGTIQCAENPPKKYEDVYPINFYCENAQELWEELKSVVTFWISKGITIFRVDNPHTKPFAFWSWLIADIRMDHPDVIFLAEAFTRPKLMSQLAKIGFHQSYTYFTWRVNKWELTQYMTELTQTELREYFRPNFWPNTPDILPYHLQHGGRPAFISRFVLAATLSSNYGIYGPAYELCIKEAVAGKEEYFDSEKYEIKQWQWDAPANIKDLITRVNKIRREHPALQTTWNVKFCEIQNDQLISYYKATDDGRNIILVIVNLDPFQTQSALVKIPLIEWGITNHQPFQVIDLLTRDRYTWQGEWNFVELNPYKMPVHILQIKNEK